MDSIGVQLKNARIRKGLSLQEVSRTSRIPVHLLEAIESDDPGKLASAFYYRSFVKQFARCVGADQSALAQLLGAASQQIPEPLVPGQDGVRVRPDLPSLKPTKTHKLRWMLSLGSLVIMLGACSAFYEFWESSRTVPESSANPRLSGKLIDPAGSGLTPDNKTDALRIKLSALENTWLSLAADGKEVFKGTLRADESKTFEGHQTARVRAVNAGGVEVVFNGRSLGKLGLEGQMRTVVFTKDSYNVLQSRLPIPLASFIRAAE